MKKISILILILTFTEISFGQHTNIEIDNSDGSDYLSESFISFNPENPDNIIIGTNLSNAYVSNDRGYTWSKIILTSTAYGAWGDPCVITDIFGNYYFFHLSNPPSNGTWVDRIVCQKSEDAGQTWNDISFVGLNSGEKNDKETAVVDRANNNIYLTWTQADAYHSTNPLDSSLILFSYSDDMGENWSVPKRLSKQAGNSNGDSGMLRSAVPTIGPSGEIYVSWAGTDELGNFGIIFDKSTDYGESWLEDDIFACDFPGGSQFHIPGIWQQDDGTDPGAGWPNIACDTSGGIYKGNIYINWADQRNGTDNTDIWMIKSTDKGNTWDAPKRVNNDGVGNQQFYSHMTVDQITGYLYFIFYDRRNHSDNSTDVYIAVSEDGGETFTNTKISETPFIPTEDVFFGDYSGLIAYNGMIRPVWTHLNGGIISIRTAILEAPLETQEQNSLFFSEELFPNPFNEEIHFSFKIKNTSSVQLRLYDIYGKEITTLINNQELKPGRYVKTLNAAEFKLSSGMYYFSLRINNKTLIKKIVFTK